MGIREMHGDEGVLSGDYENATNKLHGLASRIVVNAISDEFKLEQFEREAFHRSLTEHIIDNPEQSPTEETHLPQKTGQLMGSITLFPILCIINAIVCRWAKEIELGRKVRLHELPLLVNGDDFISRCRSETQGIWRAIAASVGLKESVGKTFFSREFLEINSTTYTFVHSKPLQEWVHFQDQRKEWTESKADWLAAGAHHPRRHHLTQILRHSPYRLVPYLNLGLLKGLKRSKGAIGLSDLGDTESSIGARYRELVRLCPAHLRAQAHRAFLEYHSKLLQGRLRGIPFYIPEWLGGLGLLGVHAPSDLDMRIAHRTLLNWRFRRPIQLSSLKQKLWRIWERAEEAMGKTHTTSRPSILTQRYDQYVSLRCIDLLFDSTKSVESLLADSQDKATLAAAIRRNQKLWSPKTLESKSLPCTGLPKPLTVDQIRYQRRYHAVAADPHELAPSPLFELD